MSLSSNFGRGWWRRWQFWVLSSLLAVHFLQPENALLVERFRRDGKFTLGVFQKRRRLASSWRRETQRDLALTDWCKNSWSWGCLAIRFNINPHLFFFPNNVSGLSCLILLFYISSSWVNSDLSSDAYIPLWTMLTFAANLYFRWDIRALCYIF